MMEKLQRFGGAMFTPVLLFAYSGIILSLAILCQSELVFGSLASDGTFWKNIWSIIETGGWTVFNHIELLFVIGIPIGLADKANARAALESFVVYTTFNNFVSKILEIWGQNFNVDFTQEVGGTSGLKMIAGVKTLDTNIIGAIIVAAIVVWIHNRYFEKKLPDWLGIFQGSSLVAIIGFFFMLPLAFATASIWPIVQGGISTLQGLMLNSGVFGVWIYVFLERILIPTGLHHFIYQPFIYGPAAIAGGIEQGWLQQLNALASNPAPLIAQFPYGGFGLHNMSKFFAPIGIGAAFYATALPEKKKETLSLIVPTAITAMLAGITEPFEFTFLFIAPPLFLLHSLLAATFASTLYLFGVVGDIGSGFIAMLSKFIIPMSINHLDSVIKLFIIGFIYSVIYFYVFKFVILKKDYKTPGREVNAGVKLYSKQEYKAKKAGENLKISDADQYRQSAEIYLAAFGGRTNIEEVTNCATRLRVSVKDVSLVGDDQEFKLGGAHGVVRKGKAFQIIVGLSVPQVREEFEKLLKQ
ncbi:alpha-glucoside-specific PTS transporter subunit IIBC [Ignavigranum ruoffiae]